MQNGTELTNDSIMRIGTAFFTSKVLLSAIEVDLFTILAAKGPLTYEQLRQELSFHERAARDFLDVLVALKMLEYKNNTYSNTPETDLFLDKNKSTYSGHWLEMANKRLYKYWDNLTNALRTGQPQNEFTDTSNPFEKIYADQNGIDNFLNEMGDVSTPLINKISEVFPWQEKKTVMDIGGCKGVFSAQLIKRQPHLTGGVFDLPQIQQGFNKYVAFIKLSDKLNFHPGDFFVDPLPQADVLVMGHILVDWDINTRKMLIAKAYAALPSKGALLIYDMMIDNTRNKNVAALLMSLNMLIETQGGSTYTETECFAWLQEAGFCNINFVELNNTHSMAIAYKP